MVHAYDMMKASVPTSIGGQLVHPFQECSAASHYHRFSIHSSRTKISLRFSGSWLSIMVDCAISLIAINREGFSRSCN